MSETKEQVWNQLRREAQEEANREPILASCLYEAILSHRSFEEALSTHLSLRLACPTVHPITLRDLMMDAHAADADLAEAAVADLQAIRERDPACRRLATPFLYFKGFHVIQSYRIAHYCWNNHREWLALHLQSRISEVFAVDIHPAARIGRGILMDHATGVVVGETAVIEDDVSILHEVTLGGTGKETGDRHPKVRRGVLISAGAKIFGNIEIGEGAKIGGGSVVLHPVAPHTTVAGVPAKLVGKPPVDAPSKLMDQRIDGSDG